MKILKQEYKNKKKDNNCKNEPLIKYLVIVQHIILNPLLLNWKNKIN